MVKLSFAQECNVKRERKRERERERESEREREREREIGENKITYLCMDILNY